MPRGSKEGMRGDVGTMEERCKGEEQMKEGKERWRKGTWLGSKSVSQVIVGAARP